MRIFTAFTAILFVLFAFSSLAQQQGFKFGQILHSELGMTSYERDTSAAAVVLNEFGYAFIDNATFNLIFEYHVKIKILKADGLSHGDFSVPLYKSQSGKQELLKEITASTFNQGDSRIEETKLDTRKIYNENVNKYWDAKKFALPNVRVGSVIEVLYTLESPRVYNFRNWEFQSTIPKVQSEYWAKIPGNYIYNITLKGPLKLSKNESSLVSKCVTYGTASADCALFKYGMKNIPAFVEEDYMTAKSNFLSAINFELSEIRHFDGRVNKITKEWKDAEIELKRDQTFGAQLKKGKDIGQKLQEPLAGVNDPKEKAVKIHHFIKTWYKWNGTFGFVTENGIKKAFDKKTGNVGDINISLIAALDYAGLNVEPMLLSTRNHGLPTELHPVLSDFNYVVAKLNIGDQVYLLDATDPYLMFGMIPERCFNGKGRVFGDKGSYWYELSPAHKSKRITMLNLSLESSGAFVGTIERMYEGYESYNHRKSLSSYNNQEEYLADLRKKMGHLNFEKCEISGANDFESPIKEIFTVTLEGFDDLNKSNLLINPFFTGKIEKNPFQTKERLYPVDFGVPFENTMVLNLKYPETFELIAKPDGNALALPSAGGKFLFDITNLGNTLTVNYSLALNKAVFNSNEYQYLKELYSRIIQVQNADLVFSRKN